MAPPSAIELIGPRVTLRPLVDDDFKAWRDVRVRNRAWLEPWEPTPESEVVDPVTDFGAFHARCGAWERERRFDSAHGFGIFVGGGELVGEVSLGNLQRGPFQSAYVGYWIDEARAGEGITPEAVVVTLKYGFEILGLHRIEAAIVPRNVPSKRVAEKLGLRNEGVSLRLLRVADQWEDHIRYSITFEEWVDRRSAILKEFLLS